MGSSSKLTEMRQRALWVFWVGLSALVAKNFLIQPRPFLVVIQCGFGVRKRQGHFVQIRWHLGAGRNEIALAQNALSQGEHEVL